MPVFAPFSHVRRAAKLLDRADRENLSPAQKYMYSSEKIGNFRTVAKLCATQSHYVLTAKDLAPPELIEELAQIGQFAEVVYPTLLPTEFVFENLSVLTQAHFPLEGYDALLDSKLLDSWQGDVAKLDSLIAYRASTRQLIVALSGTATAKQSLYDLRFWKLKHPGAQGGRVHSGFWKMYDGVRTRALEGIQKHIKENEVKGLVVTGHSLGGALASLLALDLLTTEDVPSNLLDGITLKVVGFGSPRAGDAKLVKAWRDAVADRRRKHGEDSVKEYLVKAYRDGVPSLPPASLGYRHFTERPLYLYHGRLFYIPSSENEHGSFAVANDALDATREPQYPRGGHNYYNNRDLESVARRMQWIEEMMAKNSDWESGYRDRMSKYEEKLVKKLGIEPTNLSKGSSIAIGNEKP